MTISVLVCDDLPSVQGMLRRMLERGGLVVAGVAATADEALAQYAAHRPDIVLLDYRMPGATGISLLRRLLAVDPWARVVICSGVADPGLRQRALEAGAKEWVLKPVYPQPLVALLRDLMARSPRRPAIEGEAPPPG